MYNSLNSLLSITDIRTKSCFVMFCKNLTLNPLRKVMKELGIFSNVMM